LDKAESNVRQVWYTWKVHLNDFVNCIVCLCILPPWLSSFNFNQ
jgi:hypothetical protein